MAWASSTQVKQEFDELNDLIAYKVKREKEPDLLFKSMNANLVKQEEEDGDRPTKSNEIRACLAMMEKIQQIAGTRPLGVHATMADWDDKSTVEQEAVAMVRHFGHLSVPDKLPKLKRRNYFRKGTNRKPLTIITDPQYFQPCKPPKFGDTPTEREQIKYANKMYKLGD